MSPEEQFQALLATQLRIADALENLCSLFEEVISQDEDGVRSLRVDNWPQESDDDED